MPVIQRRPRRNTVDPGLSTASFIPQDNSIAHAIRGLGEAVAVRAQIDKNQQDGLNRSKALSDYLVEAARVKSDAITNAPADGSGLERNLAAGLQEAKKKVIESNPNLSVTARDNLSASIDRLNAQEQAGAIGTEKKLQIENLGRTLDQTTNNLSAVAAGDFAQMPESIRAARAATDIAVEDGIISASAADELKRQQTQGITNAALTGLIQRDPEMALQAIKSGRFDDIMGGALVNSLKAKASTEIRQRKSLQQAEDRKAIKDADKALDDLEKVVKSGLPADQSTLEAAIVATRRAAAADPKKVDRLVRLDNTAQTVRNFARLPPDNVRNQLNRLDAKLAKGGASAADVDRRDTLKNVLTQMNTELKDDPLSFAMRAQLVDVAPLDITGSGRVESFRARARSATAVSQNYDVPEKFFTAEERTKLGGALASTDADYLNQFVKDLVSGFGADAPAALSELGQDVSGVVRAGQLSALGPQFDQLLSEATRGQAEIAKGVGKNVLAGDRELVTIYQETFAGALDSRAPKTRQSIIDLAKTIYVSRAINRGKTDFDENLFEESLLDAAGRNSERGGLGAYNGRSVLLPHDMTESEFRSTVDRLTNTDVQKLSLFGGVPIHDNGQTAGADEIKKGYLVYTGPGRYRISITDPSEATPQYLRDGSTGQYFILDMSKRLDALDLSARAPATPKRPRTQGTDPGTLNPFVVTPQ